VQLAASQEGVSSVEIVINDRLITTHNSDIITRMTTLSAITKGGACCRYNVLSDILDETYAL
jgi:hypothetical protein